MTLHNRVLNEKFEREGSDTFIARFKSMDTLKELNEKADEQQFGQFVAAVAAVGLPDEFETFEKLLEPLEVEIRKALALPSKRPGGARSKGTGYILHPTFKSYKSTVKGAYEFGVELLDAAGMPRSRNNITDDIKKGKPVKDAEDKVMGAVETYIKIDESCNQSDARTVDAENRMLNYLRAKGYTITVAADAAA